MAIAGVTIETGPQDWQILQRDAQGQASIAIAGTWLTPESTFSVQARLVHESTNDPVARHLDWQDAKLDPKTGRFRLTLRRVPQGGLYRLETRLRRPLAGDARAMRGDCVHHLGVGDVYLIAGQSNASGTGKGAVTDGPQLGVHLLGNDETWKLAVHPVEDATRSKHPVTVTSVFHGHSPWLAFGKRILARTGIPVGLVPTALGGSSVTQWVTDSGQPGPLTANLLDMARLAGGRVAGVLWHQGESDTGDAAHLDAYSARFGKLVRLLRRKLRQPDLPFITGQLNVVSTVPDPARDRGWTRMRELQRQLAHDLERVWMAVTLDCPLSDEIHDSGTACVTIGERYADLALEHLYGLPLLAAFPEPDTVRFADSAQRELRLTFRNLAGDWTPFARCDEFLVEAESGFAAVEAVTCLPDRRTLRVLLRRPVSGKAILHAHFGCAPRVALRDDGGRCLTAFSVPITPAPAEIAAATPRQPRRPSRGPRVK